MKLSCMQHLLWNRSRTGYCKTLKGDTNYLNPNSPETASRFFGDLSGWWVSSRSLQTWIHERCNNFERWEPLYGRWGQLLSVDGGDRFFHYSFTAQTSHFPSSINRGPPPFQKHTTPRVPLLLFFTYSLFSSSISSLNILGIFALKSFFASSEIFSF